MVALSLVSGAFILFVLCAFFGYLQVLFARALQSRARRRVPLPGEMWSCPSLGAVRVCTVDIEDGFLWLITLGGSTQISYRQEPGHQYSAHSCSLSAWRRAGMRPLSCEEWEDSTKHGRLP